MSTTPLKVAVTGAAGQIGYSLLFRLASGSLLGADRPIELRLLEIEPALKALEGVVMELDDCAFPTLAGVQIGADPEKIFDGVNLALLVGARPRGPGMERSDLLEANGAIFTAQGKALNDVAADDVRIGVTGNPANTNALIAMTNAPDIPQERFSALTRLDHNRAISQLAAKTGAAGHRDQEDDDLGQPLRRPSTPTSSTPRSAGRTPPRLVDDQDWLENTFIPTVAKRGAAIIDARGSSSAASAASATIDAARDWLHGSAEGDWVSMAVRSDGSYGVQEGLISSFPVTTSNGDWSIVQGLEIDDFSRGRIDATVAELAEEKDAVTELRPDLTRRRVGIVTTRRDFDVRLRRLGVSRGRTGSAMLAARATGQMVPQEPQRRADRRGSATSTERRRTASMPGLRGRDHQPDERARTTSARRSTSRRAASGPGRR